MGGEIIFPLVLALFIGVPIGLMCGLWAHKSIGVTAMGLIYTIGIYPRLPEFNFLKYPSGFIGYTLILFFIVWVPYFSVYAFRDRPKTLNRKRIIKTKMSAQQDDAPEPASPAG